jgi:hypothetical protein
MCSCCRTAGLGSLGAVRRSGAPGFLVASGAAALVSLGVTGTTVGKLLADVGTADEDRSATLQAADTSIDIPTMAEPVHHVEPRSWNPL